MPDIRNCAVLYIDTADNLALTNINQADYIRHIVSNCAAVCVKHVKPYQGEDLSQYRAGGPVGSEYFQDTGMAGKTKATVEGSPVEIKEIKRIANYATAGAGEQCVVFSEPDYRIFLRHVLFRNTSRANFSGVSRSSFASCSSFLRASLVSFSCSYTTFRLCSCSVMRALVMAIIVANEFFFWSSIVSTSITMRRSTLHHGAGGSYPLHLQGYPPVFRTNASLNTSDHLSKKAVYTESIPYKTGIGCENPFNCKATNDARSVFFSASDLHHIDGIAYCVYPCTIQSFHVLHFAQCHQQTMVMLAGLPKGRPESLQSGILTPASVTAICERENSSSDVICYCKEAATMATPPDLVHSQTAFIWRFITVGASERQIIHVTAWTERKARNRCPSGCVAVFAAKFRHGVSHG